MPDSGHQLPRDLFEIERQGPRVPALVPLSATDDQFFIGQAAGDEVAAHSAVDAVVELRLERNRIRHRARSAGTSLDRRPRSGDRADTLHARKQHLEVQAARLERKQRNINAAMARPAARWSVEQALENGCQAIAVENLRTLEARGMGARTNERVSLALRGRTAAATREAAAAEGLVVIEVTASGTSTYCPRCDRKLRPRLHPDGRDGRSWAYCPGCGFNADRDHSAAEKIGQRALSTTTVRVRRQRSARRRGPTPEICRGEAAAAASEHQPSGPGAVRRSPRPFPRPCAGAEATVRRGPVPGLSCTRPAGSECGNPGFRPLGWRCCSSPTGPYCAPPDPHESGPARRIAERSDRAERARSQATVRTTVGRLAKGEEND